jgi:hypothetical protein
VWTLLFVIVQYNTPPVHQTHAAKCHSILSAAPQIKLIKIYSVIAFIKWYINTSSCMYTPDSFCIKNTKKNYVGQLYVHLFHESCPKMHKATVSCTLANTQLTFWIWISMQYFILHIYSIYSCNCLHHISSPFNLWNKRLFSAPHNCLSFTTRWCSFHSTFALCSSGLMDLISC